MASNQKDFRSTRILLPPDAFALGPKTNPLPTDLIDKDTWDSMINLPDDVSLRTSGDYGSTLKVFWNAWNDWICLVLALQNVAAPNPADSPIAHCAGNAIDEIQGSIYNSVVGFYRLSFSALRNMLEQMTIGLSLELTGDTTSFSKWLRGDKELKFGSSADKLLNIPAIRNLEQTLRHTTGDSIFQQKTPTYTGGLARRLFRDLSQFTHGGPNHTNTDLWEGSTGPIFVSNSYEKWSITFCKTFMICVLEAKLAKPSITTLGGGSKQTIGNLFRLLMPQLPPAEDGTDIFNATNGCGII